MGHDLILFLGSFMARMRGPHVLALYRHGYIWQLVLILFDNICKSCLSSFEWVSVGV